MTVKWSDALVDITWPNGPSYLPDAVFSGSYCWQYIVIWLCTWVLDSQDSIAWFGRKEKHGGCSASWKCFPFVDMFSLTLFCFMQPEVNTTLLVVQTVLPAMSHFCQFHTLNTNCSLVLTNAPLWSLGYLSNTPSLSETWCFCLNSLLQTPIHFSCVLLLHPSCSKSRLSNY